MLQHSPNTDIIVGVDTHKHIHAAVALSALGARLGTTTVQASRDGCRRIRSLGALPGRAPWARSLGTVAAFGVEGTGFYGAGLARALREDGHRVLEVNRPDRSARRRNGKDDMLDAEAAARAVLAGHAAAEPKSGSSSVEMIRHLAALRPGPITSTTVSAKAALRATARRWLALH